MQERQVIPQYDMSLSLKAPASKQRHSVVDNIIVDDANASSINLNISNSCFRSKCCSAHCYMKLTFPRAESLTETRASTWRSQPQSGMANRDDGALCSFDDAAGNQQWHFLIEKALRQLCEVIALGSRIGNILLALAQ